MLLAAAGFLFAGASSAQIAVETYSGVVAGPQTTDAAGLFGAAGANLSGKPFSITYVTNENSPYVSCYCVADETSYSGEQRQPFTSAFLTIGGATLAITATPGAIVLGGEAQAYGGTYVNSLSYEYEPYGAVSVYNSLIASGIPVTTDLTTPISFSTAEQFTSSYQGISPGGENDVQFFNGAGHYFIDLGVETLTIGGSSLDPVTPTSTQPGGVYTFSQPVSGEFYDPPSTGAFLYRLTGGGDFTAVGAPPESDGFGPVNVVVGGVTLATLQPGDIYDFGSGVTAFQITGISPEVPTGESDAFPTFLDFSGNPTDLTMTPGDLPEPDVWVLMLLGVAAAGAGRRRQRRIQTGSISVARR